MTTLTAALKGIRAEISDFIRETVPQERVSADVAAFKEHDYADKGQPIEEIAGPARLFEIKKPIPVDSSDGPPPQGGSMRFGRYEIPVVFCYPRDSKWYAIAQDDILKIASNLTTDYNGHGVSGIDSRHIVGPVMPTVEESPEDPWDYYTLIITVWTATS